MERIKYNEEIDKVLNELTRTKILRHTVHLLRKDAHGELTAHASGVFVKLTRAHFLMTASHVVDDWTDENQLYIRIGLDQYITLVGHVKETDIDKSHKVDVAYIRIDESLVEKLEKSYIFLLASSVRDHKKMIQAGQYCIMGFPEKSITEQKGRKEPLAQAYFVSPSKEKVYDYYKFNPKIFHLLEMKGKGKDIKTGTKTKVDSHFHGMSGCGLWLLILTTDGTSYSVDYRLIGIMSEFRKGKYFCMIGVKILVVIQALQQFEGVELKEKRISNT